MENAPPTDEAEFYKHVSERLRAVFDKKKREKVNEAFASYAAFRDCAEKRFGYVFTSSQVEFYMSGRSKPPFYFIVAFCEIAEISLVEFTYSIDPAGEYARLLVKTLRNVASSQGGELTDEHSQLVAAYKKSRPELQKFVRGLLYGDRSDELIEIIIKIAKNGIAAEKT